MTDMDLSKLRELLENIGPLPIDPDWMYTVIRHGQRNMDIDVAEGFNEPERQSGYPMGELINALPSLFDEIERLTALCKANNTLARMNGEHRDQYRERAVKAEDAAETLAAELTTAREALAKHATRFEHCADMIAESHAISGNLRAERTIKAKHYALEARAALRSGEKEA